MRWCVSNRRIAGAVRRTLARPEDRGVFGREGTTSAPCASPKPDQLWKTFLADGLFSGSSQKGICRDGFVVRRTLVQVSGLGGFISVARLRRTRESICGQRKAFRQIQRVGNLARASRPSRVHSAALHFTLIRLHLTLQFHLPEENLDA
jgi:hypothetical protein